MRPARLVGEGIVLVMLLRSHSRAERRFAPWRNLTVYSAVELLLLVLIAIQAARLIWTLVTPVGPVGEWRPPGAIAQVGEAALIQFDPFFRLSGDAAGPAVVTNLNLKLYGVREDRATGRGSAIIALADGAQRSFAVGEEIMPGVTLAEVGFDNVTIARNGAREQIFLDQSQSAPAGEAAGPAAPAPGAPRTVEAATALQAAPIRLEPQMGNSQIEGLTVSPGNDGGRAFRSAGFQPGDVIISVNGQRVMSMEQAQSVVRSAGGNVNVVVRRGGRTVPMRVRLDL